MTVTKIVSARRMLTIQFDVEGLPSSYRYAGASFAIGALLEDGPKRGPGSRVTGTYLALLVALALRHRAGQARPSLDSRDVVREVFVAQANPGDSARHYWHRVGRHLPPDAPVVPVPGRYEGMWGYRLNDDIHRVSFRTEWGPITRADQAEAVSSAEPYLQQADELARHGRERDAFASVARALAALRLIPVSSDRCQPHGRTALRAELARLAMQLGASRTAYRAAALPDEVAAREPLLSAEMAYVQYLAEKQQFDLNGNQSHALRAEAAAGRARGLATSRAYGRPGLEQRRARALLAQLDMNQGRLLARRGQRFGELALRYLREAGHTWLELGDPSWYGHYWSHMAAANSYLGRIDAAHHALEKATDLAMHLSPAAEAVRKRTAAGVFAAMGDRDRAATALEEAIRFSTSRGYAHQVEILERCRLDLEVEARPVWAHLYGG